MVSGIPTPSPSGAVKVVRTRRGARLVQDDVVLSEILERPGPTHTFFDVLAAAVAALAPGPRFAMLGFAGGGVMAPLRAMGFAHRVEAVALSRGGLDLFRDLSGAWAGGVRFARADAAVWLRRSRTRYDVIMDDLSPPSPAGVVKPRTSLDTLPALMRNRLRPGGIAIVNLLSLPGTPWASLLARVARPHKRSVVIALDEYENRIVVAGGALETATDVSRRVRAALRGIGSRQASKIAVRTLR
jgi:spermidine synthase